MFYCLYGVIVDFWGYVYQVVTQTSEEYIYDLITIKQ